jgi:hypothetical protein
MRNWIDTRRDDIESGRRPAISKTVNLLLWGPVLFIGAVAVVIVIVRLVS